MCCHWRSSCESCYLHSTESAWNLWPQGVVGLPVGNCFGHFHAMQDLALLWPLPVFHSSNSRKWQPDRARILQSALSPVFAEHIYKRLKLHRWRNNAALVCGHFQKDPGHHLTYSIVLSQRCSGLLGPLNRMHREFWQYVPPLFLGKDLTTGYWKISCWTAMRAIERGRIRKAQRQKQVSIRTEWRTSTTAMNGVDGCHIHKAPSAPVGFTCRTSSLWGSQGLALFRYLWIGIQYDTYVTKPNLSEPYSGFLIADPCALII